MNAEADRLKKRKKYLKLRKKHPWISIPVFLISLSVCALVFMLLINLIIQFALESRLNAAAERVSSLAAVYEDSGEDALRLLDKQGISYVLTDQEGAVLHQFGAATYGGKHGLYDDRESIYLYEDTAQPFLRQETASAVDFDYPEMGKIVGGVLAREISVTGVKEVTILEEDLENSDNSEAISTLEGLGYNVTVNEDGEPLSVSDKVIGLPLWIAADVHEGAERIIMQVELTFLISDLETVIFLLLLLLLIFLCVVGSMLADMIAGFVNQARISRVLFTDMATKGRNRFWFLFRGDQILRKRFAGKNPFAVVNLYLVRYQSLCLCHSLAEGEQLLSAVQDTLNEQMQKREICAHDNDGNFAMLLRYEDAEMLAERVRRMIAGLEKLDNRFSLAFHAGIAPVNGSGIRKSRNQVDIELEYTNACSAAMTLDESEDSGVAFFDQKLVDEQKWVDTVTACEHRALENEEFLVYYQPKYDPQTSTLRGAEALIRWQSAEFGFISPGRFIPIFEKNGFITEIDHYMLRHAARDQRRWLDQGLKCVPVSVNVSRAHFIESDLAEQIRDLVDAEGTPHELIEIELTESAFFDDKKAMIRTILKLKEYGFAVSMDDFGSGYSSLNSLKDMPLDVLKLDAEFFRGEEAGTDRGEIVVSEAIKLAKSLHMRTVAEGVEVREQVEFLASQGCDMIQGYYFAKPMPGAEYELRMRSGAAQEAPETSEAPVSLEKPQAVEA